MSRNYDLKSPGVDTYEIDNSGLPDTNTKVGPLVIGRALRGPAFRPVQVESMDDFIQIFGNPNAGGVSGDTWRDGNIAGPTYGAYAAQAYLSKTSPLTYIRILGDQHTNASASGKAGWKTTTTPNATEASNGGAFGLFMIDSGSSTSGLTGTLGAVFYLNEGSVTLSGTYRNGVGADAAAALIESKGTYKEFTAVIRNAAGTIVKKSNFNFSPTSEKFIRKVFNTNPTLCNSDITSTDNLKTYWLGETFERSVATYVTGSGAGLNFGFIGALASGSYDASNYQYGFQSPKTGWFISQDLDIVESGVSNTYNPENMKKLFRFHGLQTGEWEQRNVKISIEDIKAPTRLEDSYGSFTVTVRDATDSDGAPKVLERYTGLNLNPSSSDYIAKRIGDIYTVWDYTNKVDTEYGVNRNISKYIRVEMNPSLEDSSENPALLPFGIYGPPVFQSFTFVSGSEYFTQKNNVGVEEPHVFVKGNGALPRTIADIGTEEIAAGSDLAWKGCFVFPTIPVRTTSSDSSLPGNKQAYFGASTQKSSSTQFDEAYCDLIRCKPYGIDSYDANGTNTIPSWIFTLDNLVVSDSVATFTSGSRAAGTSLTAVSGGYAYILSAGFNKFTAPLYGGFDGFDITEVEPLRNTGLTDGSETSSYAYNSIRRSIDMVSDNEYIECNIVALPGITNESLTSYLISTCENRKDSLALFDVKGGYQPSSETSSVESSRLGSVEDVVTNMKARGDNSSYACSYHPWVKMRDIYSSKDIWIPPSAPMLGVFGNVEDKKELWSAPAGNILASLSKGASGLNIVGVRERLTKNDRDELYSYNINPIAIFPTQGITVYGQKTLLSSETSALNRINVRRMMNYIKREVKKHAEDVLFEQNVRQTWDKFVGKVEPFLRTIKSRFGLIEYKLILDETTTTKEMIDRNSMYAKIYLKPARAIEKIYIDFIITDSGVEFTS